MKAAQILGYAVVLFAFILTSDMINHVFAADKNKPVVACYVMFWSAYRQKDGTFQMQYIDPNICTHIIYSYNTINPRTMEVVPLDPHADFTPGLGNFERLIRLKDENPNLKILVSLGGWSEGSKVFSAMGQSYQNRTNFINNALIFLSQNQLDGIDIDWQHPTQRGGSEQDRDNFPILLHEMRKAFDGYGYLLTVRLVGMRFISDPGYDVEKISKAVHYINLRTFGYHGDWETKTGIHAPLTSDDEFNVEFSVNYMLRKGAQPEKILLGIRPGGSAVLMTQSADNDAYSFVGNPINGKFPGTLTQQPGFIGYNDLCWGLSRNEKWRVFWHNSSSTPYAVLGKKFISYDDTVSIKPKLKLLERKELGGVNIYSIDTDDFHGFCSKNRTSIKFPMTRAIREYLLGEIPQPQFSTSVVNHNYPENRRKKDVYSFISHQL